MDASRRPLPTFGFLHLVVTPERLPSSYRVVPLGILGSFFSAISCMMLQWSFHGQCIESRREIARFTFLRERDRSGGCNRHCPCVEVTLRKLDLLDFNIIGIEGATAIANARMIIVVTNEETRSARFTSGITSLYNVAVRAPAGKVCYHLAPTLW